VYADAIEGRSVGMEKTSQAQYRQRLATSQHSPICTNDEINHSHFDHITADGLAQI
jgi:hypothetical protein